MADSHVEVFKRIVRRTARELNERQDSEVVQRVSTWRMLRRNLTAAILRGERISPSDLDQCDANLKPYDKPLAVTLTIVDKPWTLPDPPPAPPPAPPAPVEAAPVKPKPAPAPPQPAPALTADPVCPMFFGGSGTNNWFAHPSDGGGNGAWPHPYYDRATGKDRY